MTSQLPQLPPQLPRMIGEPQRQVQLRQGQITAAPAGDGTVTVRVGGPGATPVAGVRRLASTSVWNGDVVWVLQQGYDLLVLGPVAGAGSWGGAQLFDGLEIYHDGATPYIDFHRAADPAGDANADYNMRLINEASGYLVLYGGTFKAPVVEATGAVYASNWFRSYGDTGWYSQTHGGGVWMNDSTWVKVYGGKGFYVDNEVKVAAGVGFNARDVCFMGPSGAHGTGWAQFGHWAYRASSPHYGFMHNGGTALVSADEVILRYQNANRLAVDANAVSIFNVRAVLNSNRVDTRAYGDDWHTFQWWSGNDGWRQTEYGGFYYRVRDSDPVFRIDATGQSKFHRFDQIGAYDQSAIMTHSSGGGTGAKVGYWSAGQNAAHIHKCWGSSIEVRTWDDGGWGYSVGDFNDVCTMRAKLPESVEALADRMPKAQRRAKHKRVRAVKFQRPLEDGCANCLGTGLKAKRAEFSEAEQARLVAASLFGADLEPCPDCAGTGKKKPDGGAKKNHDTGWLGFVAEEIAEEFPEAIYYREDEDGVTRPTAMKPSALIAILWEDNKDQQEEIDALEARLAALEQKGGK